MNSCNLSCTKYILSGSFMICTVHKIFFGDQMKKNLGWVGHVWETGKVHTEFW